MQPQFVPTPAPMTSPMSPPPMPKKGMSPWLAVGIAAVVILAYVAFSAYAGMWPFAPAATASPTPTASAGTLPTASVSALPNSTTSPTPTSTASISPTVNPTAGWKTYTNDLFSIAVPATLAYDSGHSTKTSMAFQGPDQSTTPTNGLDLTLWPSNPQSNCVTDVEAFQILSRSVSAGSNGHWQTITAEINGTSHQGVESWAVGASVAPAVNVVYAFPFCRNGNVFNVEFQIGGRTVEQARASLPLIDQILSTFKFTK